MKKIYYYSIPLYNINIKGDTQSLAQLKAKFQIWCRTHKIADTESHALLEYGKNSEKETPHLKEMAEMATKKFPKEMQKKIKEESGLTIDLSNI